MTKCAQPGLAREEFAALMAPFGPFEAQPVLAVGVSGGRDSLCLAFLAQEWARERSGTVLALIVDHGLRIEAAAEAKATSALLTRHGIASEILRWVGKKPVSRLQADARRARYALLLDACQRHRILHLLVAHHAEDQAETVAMRAARGSGRDGLAGMAALTEHRQARLLRPLLAVSRSRLTAALIARGIEWIEDPSNTDLRFERVRLRQEPTGVPAIDCTAGPERTAREIDLARLAVGTLEFDEPDAVGIDKAAFCALRQAGRARLLGRVVQAVGKRDHPPRRQRLDRALARLSQGMDRGRSGKRQDFTLSECRLILRRAPGNLRLRWIVAPESGRKDERDSGQPLIPAAFFACDQRCTPHLD